MNIKPLLLMSSIIVSSLAFLPLQDVVAKENQLVQTKHSKHDKKYSMKRQFKKMARHLQLSEEQKVKVKAIFEQAKDSREEQRASMKDFKEQVKSLMQSTVFDDKAFTEIHSQYQATFAEMALLKAKNKHAIYQVLTPEQREKFSKFKMKNRR